ncbi:FAD-dependent oxidoreductase [uncultured Castellaniella sp.]|uniref:NAD(P)/FAD-dependent oxidoreductase n=1 Tax=uncultured Castellaniella sp. TaxID=647907 RepID=UPI00262FA4ED|nr:FAD-dependent oxidoreductase [uncultured Castellaniella sp.]
MGVELTRAYSDKPWPPSLWKATSKEAFVCPALSESCETRVIVVGAGYTGLSTALHLAEMGVDVVVLEAEQPGWGASGRNGGQVIPGLKYDPDELSRRLGDLGESVVELAGGAADVVFDLIRKYRILCDPVRKGWIQTAHSEQVFRIVQRRCEEWARRGAKVALLDATEVEQRIGYGKFVGGWVDYRAGSVQPLAYALGLARAAHSNGARIFSRTRVTRLEKVGEQWCAHTDGGCTVKGSKVLIATNGYTDDLWPGLRKTILSAQSFVVATSPLQGEADRILAGGEVTSDSRRLLVYFRRDHEGRLVLGGRGPVRHPVSTAEWSHVERALELMFPVLKGIGYDYRWHGRIAITADFMPHVHEPEKGLTIALGYNGRGIAMATTMGKLMAASLASGEGFRVLFPVTPVRTIPLHQLQQLYMVAGVMWYRFLDALS